MAPVQIFEEGGTMLTIAAAHPARRVFACFLLVAVSLGASGCIRGLFYKNGARSRLFADLTVPGDRQSPRDYYIGFQGTKRQGGGAAFEILPYFLFGGPFTLEWEIGLFDPSLAADSDQALGCLELFEYEAFGDLAATWDFCGQYNAGGYVVFNSENADQLSYPATLRVQARVVFDGADLSYETRPSGDPTWDIVTAFPFAPTMPLLPSIGGTNLRKGGVVNFDSFSWTDTMPVDTTTLGQFGWHIQEAFQFEADAFRALDGASPDFASAASSLSSASGQLSLAYSFASFDSKVARLVVKGDRAIIRAREEADAQDQAGAVKKLQKGIRYQGQAFQRAYALDYRPQF
jgi:hypothetical protein